MRTEHASVAIVGFGPAGIFVAGLLARRGVDVVVVERADDVFPLPRAAHIDHTALRVLQELGLSATLMKEMTPNSALVLADADLEPLVTIPASTRSRSGYPASMYFYQPDFDRTVSTAVAEMDNVTVLRGVEMESFSHDAEGVVLQCRDVHTGKATIVEADWLVGADGSWSPVREGLGIGLESLEFDEEWLVLDLVLAEGAQVPDYALQVCDPRRPWVSNPVPGGRYRVEIKLFEADDKQHIASVEFLSGFLQPLLGDTRFEIERNAVYTFHGLLADRWRSGRVLIAGDAAHQMPPFLGQGMCSGIRDAANLAWKLAGVIHGRFDHSILDTYESERSPHARSIIASAIRVGSFVSLSDPVAAETRNRELRAGDLSHAPTFHIPPLTSGPLVLGGGTPLPQPAGAGTPTLDGRLGDGMVILTTMPLEDSADLEWWTDAVGARMIVTSELGEDAPEVDAWFAAIGAEIAVVRPDRYLLATGRSLQVLTADARAGWPARRERTREDVTE